MERSVIKGQLYETSKRLLDLFLSLIGIVIFSPLFLIISVVIGLDDGRPIFFLTQRTGRQGQRFLMYKFRSMSVGAESGAQSTAKNDPRVTRIGRVLRHSKLDELPQLFNVLKGDMSLVGPRPEFPRYTDQYSGTEKLILTIRPGLTDYSSLQFIQLADHLGEQNPDQAFEQNVLPLKNALRLKYVYDRSFMLDLKLIFVTIVKLIFRR